MAGESKGHASITAIAVAAITTIGVIVAAFLQRDDGGKASTSPTSTPNAASITRAVAAVPTSISTILPTTTTSPRPAIIVDGFDDRLNVTLPTNSDDPHTWQYGVTGSEYRIAKVDPDADIVVTSFIPGFFADATMSIDSRMMGPIDGRFISIGCRGRRSDLLLGYLFSIYPDDGSFELEWFTETDRASVIPRTRSSSIATDTRTNHLELSCIGSVITASVNGMKLAAVQDRTFADGAFYLAVGVFDTHLPGTVEARFDNLRVSLP